MKRQYCVYEMEVKYKRTELRTDAPRLSSPDDCVSWFNTLCDDMQEKFIVVYLDARNKVLCCNTEFSGGLTSSAVYVAPIARHALLCGAARVILIHNHPSGCLEASTDDIQVTARIKASLEMLEIRVLDHMIISKSGHYSFASEGKL